MPAAKYEDREGARIFHFYPTRRQGGQPLVRVLLLRGRRIDNRSHFGNLVCRESALGGMFSNHVFVGRAIDAIDLVIGYKTLDPLDLWAKVVEHAARLL